ncbi:TetR/AcrR family transcriptional regulator [Microlunatus elymi]|uniref:TetR/AcrR family transcriptional regulator n=1 Tax=Microlunatus elymi TaxID=2596828 RepID=A0A516Q6G1_9ACTN|nr:TetR/AcrR family transcriptional regulator [Microlunatus elymi]
MIAAAQTLFLERGYAATTMEAISRQSDVPSATVYRLFSSKLGILRAMIAVSVDGTPEAIPLPEQPEARELLKSQDPTEQLAGFAAICRQVNDRTCQLYQVLVSAAASDPAAADLLAELAKQRKAGQDRIARALSRDKSLRPGLRQRDAADIIHALMSPELYRLLVIDRGWKPDKYQSWLAGTLIDQLLSARD